MLEEIGVKHTYHTPVNNTAGSYKIKEEVGDFIVQEVVDGRRCTISPVVDLEQFRAADNLLKNPIAPDLTKEERRNLYALANYHPFRRMHTVDGKLCVETRSTDVFVFTLLKCNYSMVAIRNLLAKRLGVSLDAIQTCGTKDKRAVTIQEVSVKCSFERLFNYAISLSKNPKIRFIDLGYQDEYDQTNQSLCLAFSEYMAVEHDPEITDEVGIFNIRRGSSKKLGELDGNFFTIRVRGFHGSGTSSRKFYNYFGPQRFGINLNNHIVGNHILSGEEDKAIDLILNDGTEHDHPNSTQRMVRRLVEAGRNPAFIISRLPRDLKMTYLHSHQSYLFNRMINDRIESGTPDIVMDKIMKDGEVVSAHESNLLDEIYIPLLKMNNKLLKGGLRKMVEEMLEFEEVSDENGTIFKFFLRKSCYATIAIRELIGDGLDDSAHSE